MEKMSKDTVDAIQRDLERAARADRAEQDSKRFEALLRAAQEVVNDSQLSQYKKGIAEVDADIMNTLCAAVQAISDAAVAEIQRIQQESRAEEAQ